MKKIIAIIITVLLLLMAMVTEATPAFAGDYPLPPASWEMPWHPPYEGGGSINPPVKVEVYGQTWSNLHIPLPDAVPTGIPGSIDTAYLVNSYGQVVSNLYRNGTTYLLVSVNGPGYFYLWEYYPSEVIPYGHWLCYRWSCPYAGVWRLGPFNAETFDPAGRYTWKMWFLSGTMWSNRSVSFNYVPSVLPDIPELVPSPLYSPVIDNFSVSKSSIEAGETINLNWKTSNATSVTISPDIGSVGLSGSTSVAPLTTTTYTLEAKSKSGSTVTSSITVTVAEKIEPVISVDQTKITASDSAILTWDAPGATSVSITDIGSVSSSGTMEVKPGKTTTYTLSASYSDGTTQTASVKVDVEQPLLLIIGLLILIVIVAAVITLLWLRRRNRNNARAAVVPEPQTETMREESTHLTDALPATTPLVDAHPAMLTLPNGNSILLAGNTRSFGRHDFEEFMPHDQTTYISRQHFTIWYDENKYQIEDRNSTNGTSINSSGIRGKGQCKLSDGDVIELAGKLRITFKENLN